MAKKKKSVKKPPSKKSKVSSPKGAKDAWPRLIGVIHLPALPGAPGALDRPADVALSQAGAQAIREAIELEKAGFDALVIENFGDAPFYKDAVPVETVASLSILAAAVREAVRIPVGVNVLRNAGAQAMAIASVAGCDFIRVNVLSGVAATDQGIVETDAARILRDRARFQSSVAVFADVLVKHSVSLSVSDLELAIEEVGLRSGADAVILTGSTTGREVDSEQLDLAWKITREKGIPLYLGSGVTLGNLTRMKSRSDGMIVGSALRQGGRAGAPLDVKRVKSFVQAFRKSVKIKK